MQRTALLYAVAISTLLGAFMLVVAKPSAPPDPVLIPADPPPPTGAAVTHLSYADSALEVEAKLDRGAILRAAAGEPVWMDVTLRARSSSTRGSLASVLVIDRSGSMAGDKIDNARLAAERFLKNLQDGDQVAVISYGTDVSVDVPLAVVDPTTRARAERAVRRIEEGGGTNIDGALAAAIRTVQSAKLDGLIPRVVLISDGNPTEGERRIDRLAARAEELRRLGVTTSTIGVGLDYNEDLMETVATRGGGRYHYLKRSNEMARILRDELSHASSLVARDVRLFVTAQHSGALQTAAAPGLPFAVQNGRAQILVGDLAAGEVRRLLVRLDPAAAHQAASLSLAAPEISYRTPSSAHRVLAHRADTFRLLVTTDQAAVESSRRDDVRARVLEVQSAVELTESMQAFAAGRVDDAVQKLERNKTALKRMARDSGDARLEAEAQNLEQVLRRVRSAAPSSVESQELVKEQKAHAYGLRR